MLTKIQFLDSDNVDPKIVEPTVGHTNLDFIPNFETVDVGTHESLFINFDEQFKRVAFDI